MRKILSSFSLLALSLSACADGGAVAQSAAALDIPSTIALPPGQHIVLEAHGYGFQIYECAANTDGSRAWTFHAPSAVLIAPDGQVVATHFGGIDAGLPAGVYWQSPIDGSRVHGGKAITAPNPGAIPLVRLESLDNAGDGIFSDVSFIHRLDTQGGVGPTGECPHVGVQRKVPYDAEYVFYAAALPRPEVPDNIKVAAGFDVAHTFHATGFQVYQCTADANGNLAFTFRAPRASLFNTEGVLEVNHFGGIEAGLPPGVYWQSVHDGSRVLAGNAITAPNPGNIPLVRLTALDTTGNGILSRVAFVQRLATHGGVSPTGPCSPEGTQAAVPYSADYFFYVPNVDGQ